MKGVESGILQYQHAHRIRPDQCFQRPFSNKTSNSSLKKWLILGLGQIIYKMSLEHLVGPERSTQKEKQNSGALSKGHTTKLKEFPMVKAETT